MGNDLRNKTCLMLTKSNIWRPKCEQMLTLAHNRAVQVHNSQEVDPVMIREIISNSAKCLQPIRASRTFLGLVAAAIVLVVAGFAWRTDADDVRDESQRQSMISGQPTTGTTMQPFHGYKPNWSRLLKATPITRHSTLLSGPRISGILAEPREIVTRGIRPWLVICRRP